MNVHYTFRLDMIYSSRVLHFNFSECFMGDVSGDKIIVSVSLYMSLPFAAWILWACFFSTV